MARGESKPARPKKHRWRQIRETYTLAREVDRWIGWIALGVMLGVFALVFLLGWLIDAPILFGIFGVVVAIIAGTIVFGRRTERAMYQRIEGQPGAAAAALGTLRRGWTMTPGVAVTRNQDAVHRVVGRPGIVLVAEGSPQRVTQLLANERKKHARVAGDIPIHDLIVGRDPGQIELRRLSGKVMKLPRALRPAQVAEVNYRLRALNASPVAIPKGPLPRNIKLPKGGMPGAGRPGR